MGDVVKFWARMPKSRNLDDRTARLVAQLTWERGAHEAQKVFDKMMKTNTHS